MELRINGYGLNLDDAETISYLKRPSPEIAISVNHTAFVSFHFAALQV